MSGPVLKLPPLRLLPKTRSTGDGGPEYYSLIDLGADTIKVAVVEVQNDQVKVLGNSLATTEGRDIAGGRAEAAALTAAVNGALREAEDASETIAGRKIVPDKALFILPGRSLAGKLFMIKQRRTNRSQPISQKEVDMLWERAIRLARQGLKMLPDVGADWVPHTVTPAGLWVDGHLVNDPLGLQGASLSLSVYGVICQPAIIRALKQLAERLELEIHRMVAASQALAAIIPTRDALAFDIGWSGTDCYLVRHDALVAVGRTFRGGNFFTRSLAQAFKYDLAAAESLKLAFSSNNVLSKQDTILVRQKLHPVLEQWADLAIETIVNLSGLESLPGQLYFVGGGAVLPGLKSYLLQTMQQAGLTFERAPEITNLGEAPLNGFSHAPTGFRGMLFALVLSLAKTI